MTRTKTNFVTQQQLKTIRGGQGIGHVHSNKDVLDLISPEMIHSHSNKDIIDSISQGMIDGWETARTLAHSHQNRAALDLLRYNAELNVIYVGDEDNRVSFAAYGEVSAGGIGGDTPVTAGALYSLSDVFGDITYGYVKRSDGSMAISGDALVFDGTKWLASPVQGGGGITQIKVNTTVVPVVDGVANIGPYVATYFEFRSLAETVSGKQDSLGTGSEGQVLKWVSGSPAWSDDGGGGSVDGIRMNGTVKYPDTNKIVDLGTVLTEHQSLAGYATESWVLGKNYITASALTPYRTSVNQDTIDDEIKERLATIEGLIPSAATTSNQLADKAFVTSSISTAAATFRGTSVTGLTEAQFLTWANGLTKDNNDYVFWNTTDSAGNAQLKRYKYNGSSWVYEYTLNNSSFTASQRDAINSGLTSSDKTALDNTLALIATYGNIVTHNVSEFATAVQGAKADTAYQKPTSGIPYADLSAGVKGSLSKADSALQSHQSVTLAGGTNNGTLKLTTHAGTVDNIAVTGLKALAFKASLTFSDLTSHPTTISGYGITDAYTGAQVDAKEVTAVSLTATKLTLTKTNGNLEANIPTWNQDTTGNAATATKLATARNIWGQSFDGTAAISGDMSSVGKIDFSGKATDEIGLEVKVVGGVRYLHTTLPFYSDKEIAAGGVGESGEIISYLYQLNDVPDYRTLYRGKYLRAKSDGSGVEWVDVQGGASTFAQLTGSPYDNTSLATALNGKQDAISDISTIRTRADEGHTAYGWGNHANAGYALVSDIPTSLSQLSTDSTHRLVTDTQITAWNNKWDYNENTIKAVKVNDAGNADALGGHPASYFATAESLKNYLPLTGGTVTGAITFAANDSYGIFTASDNYCSIGASAKRFFRAYISNIYGTTIYESNTALSNKYHPKGGLSTLDISAKDITAYGNIVANGSVTAASLALAGAITGATKISFSASSEPTPSDLEVVTKNGVRYLHTNLPFYSDQEVAAGNYGNGGGGWGLSTAYLNGQNLADGAVMRFGVKINGAWATLATDATYGKFINIDTTLLSVTSVGLTVPTGFTVTGSPITSNGTLAIGFAIGYSLPTTAKQNYWDEKISALISDASDHETRLILAESAIDDHESRIAELERRIINS